MAGGSDKELLAEIVAHELVLPHWHVGEAATIQFVINAIEVVGTEFSQSVKKGTGSKVGHDHSHMLAHVAEDQLETGKAI